MPAAVSASRVRRVSSSSTMKMAGVSLIAAARPMPRPAGRPRDTRQISVSTSASRNRFTCPRNSVWYTGSSSSPAATIAASTSRVGLTPASLSVSRQAQASAATEASSQASPATTAGSASRGLNSAAANGG